MNEITVVQENQLEKINNYFQKEDLIDFLSDTYGFDKVTVQKRASEFVTMIALKDLKEKDNSFHKPLVKCSPLSKQRALMSIIAWNLPADSRDFFYLYNNNGEMTCETSYKGLKYIASQNGVESKETLIFEGDEVQLEENSEGDTYSIKRGNPFGRKKIIGFLASISIRGGKQKVYTYSFDELEAGRQASIRKMKGKESPAWKYFPNDMYLKIGIKKCLKLSLSTIEVSSNIRSAFDDEIIETQILEPQSLKTAEFASLELEYQPSEEYLELFDELSSLEDNSLDINDSILILKRANKVREDLIKAEQNDMAEELAELIKSKMRKGIANEQN